MKKSGNWFTRLYFYVEQPLKVRAIGRTFFVSAEGHLGLRIGFSLDVGWITTTLEVQIPCLTLTAGWDFIRTDAQ